MLSCRIRNYIPLGESQHPVLEFFKILDGDSRVVGAISADGESGPLVDLLPYPSRTQQATWSTWCPRFEINFYRRDAFACCAPYVVC